jgi:NTE family protein
MADSSNTVRRALVLSGGGGRGAYQAGVWRRLQEIGWQPDMICGTSIGSVNGALIGSGYDADKLEDFWKGLHEHKIINLSLWKRLKYHFRKMVGKNPEWQAYMSSDPLRNVLTEAVDIELLRQDKPRVTVAATNIRTAQLEYFSGEELLIDHIVASCSIPLLFPWCEIAGERYWDGAVYSNTPVFPALEAGAKEILVVFLTPMVGTNMDPPKSTAEAICWSLDMLTEASIQTLARSLALHVWEDVRDYETELATHHVARFGGLKVGVVAPTASFGLASILDLDPENIRARLEAGYRDATEQLAEFCRPNTGNQAQHVPG